MFSSLDGLEYMSSEAQDVVGAVAGVLIAAAIVVVLLAIVLYVIKSLGLHAIAKRRGIGCAWLAWLPIGCEWITASIGDQYRKVTSGKATFRRFIVLILAVASIGLSVATRTVMDDKADEMQELAEYVQMHSARADEDEAMDMIAMIFEEVGEVFGSVFLFISVSAVLSLASKIYWYVSAGDVYASCCPKNATMMLVLSIFLPVLEPFFFFCNKEKDAGMVPLNQPAAPQFAAPQPVVESAAPVWEAPVTPVQTEEEVHQPIYEAPAQTPVEPWAASDTRPEPWENPEN